MLLMHAVSAVNCTECLSPPRYSLCNQHSLSTLLCAVTNTVYVTGASPRAALSIHPPAACRAEDVVPSGGCMRNRDFPCKADKMLQIPNETLFFSLSVALQRGQLKNSSLEHKAIQWVRSLLI